MGWGMTNIPDLEGNLNVNHPVGSAWISTDPTSPASLFGGEWESLPSGAAIISADGVSYKAGQSYGASEVKLKESDIPTVRPDTRVGGGTESRESLFFKKETYQYGTGWQNKKNLIQYNNPAENQTAVNLLPLSVAFYVWRRVA